jgi:hypothetical protein
MAYLTKQQYERRNENAADRMAQNAAISSLSPEQHEALAELCSARHALHSNKKTYITGNNNELVDKLILCNDRLKESSLQTVPGIPTGYKESFIDVDTIYLLEELGEAPEHGTDEYDQWYENEYYRISNELEELNSTIEVYLLDIDKTHGTSYCPTGKTRVF